MVKTKTWEVRIFSRATARFKWCRHFIGRPSRTHILAALEFEYEKEMARKTGETANQIRLETAIDLASRLPVTSAWSPVATVSGGYDIYAARVLIGTVRLIKSEAYVV